MDFTFAFHPMTPEAAQALTTWRYPAPYDTYDIGDDPAAMAELLDTRSPWFVAFDVHGTPMGYCCFGTSAEVGWEGEPRLWTTNDRTLSVGLGLRPDLTGKGIGLPFLNSVLTFAARQYAPEVFRLFVLPFNRRAIQVYERAGFEKVDESLVRISESQELLFLEMRRDVERNSAS